MGYVSREELKKDKVSIGSIVLDAVFTPIRKVNYEVENMRVGDRTDYNRLRFSIETDGSHHSGEGFGKIDRNNDPPPQGNHRIPGKREVKLKKVRREKETDEEAIGEEEETVSRKEIEGGDKEVLKTRVQDLELSVRTLNALESAGIRTLGGLAKKKESDLMEIEGAGKKRSKK